MSARKPGRLRQEIAQEAARILAHNGSRDYRAAKQKAAARLGLQGERDLPSNREIEEALEGHQRLFSNGGAMRLRHLREAALEAMRLLERFQPRLVGPVLSGILTSGDAIQLHLFTDTPEEVAIFLMDRGIPFEETQRRFRYGGENVETRPVWRFVAGEATLELAVFPVDGLREAPRSPVDGRPMPRASTTRLEELLKADQSNPIDAFFGPGQE